MREKMVRDFLLKFFLKECEKILKKKIEFVLNYFLFCYG